MGFLAPWFLGGLLALGVPVFVHLLRRHVTTPRPVGSLMFYERGMQSSTRHRRLKHLLLFALRLALLLLLVLAFANPFVRRPANDPNGRLLLLVLDRSYSMRAGTRFAEAKQQALALLAAKPPAQKAQLMALGGRLEILTQPISDAAQLRSALEGVEPGDGRGNFGELSGGVRNLAETVHSPVDLHLFSDLQRSAMPANFADLLLRSNVALLLHPVAKGSASPNWTVESVEAPAELADPKDPTRSRVKAVIAGFGTPATTKSVALIVNGKAIATRRVDVPADGRVTVEFAPLEVAFGFNRCEVRVEGGDAFSGDDASVFAVRRSDPERVLFVHAADDRRSTVYFSAALEAAAQASFVLQSVSTPQAADLDPSRYAFVVLSDVVALPPIFERTLAQYAEKGGSVLIALGTRAGHQAKVPLWEGTVKEPHEYVRGGAPATVAQVDFTHPVLSQPNPGRDSGGWAETRIFYAAAVNAGGARVAARLNDGTPLLLERQTGQGHILLLASGLDNLTNDLPLHPVFVSFVDQAARYLSGSGRLSGARLVDGFVQLRPATEAVGSVAAVEVVDPMGRRPLSLSEAQTAQTLRLTQAGFYQIRFSNGRDAVLGVNPDRRESNLEPIPDDVQKLWSGSAGNGSGETRADSSGHAAVSGADEARGRRVSLWWYVMLLALLITLAETTIASGYLGTQRDDA